jgi:hypothetical protein
LERIFKLRGDFTGLTAVWVELLYFAEQLTKDSRS